MIPNNLANETAGLLEVLKTCKKELQVKCKDGEVHINSNTLRFTFIGLFGSMVSNHIIKQNVFKDPAKKLMILQAHMNQYSQKIGGFTLNQI